MDTFKVKVWYSVMVLVVAFGLVAIIMIAPALSRWGAAQAPVRTISVSAQGKTTATPDLAEVSFSVITQGQNPDTISSDNNKKMSSVIDFVKSLNIASSDIATVGYDLSPNYQTQTTTGIPSLIPGTMVTTNESRIIGYTITQTVQVKVRDFAIIPKLVSGLTPLGINQVNGINFTFDDPEKFLSIARADALAKAKAKAGEMAMEAGTVSLGKVMTISEYGNVPMYSAMNESVKAMAAGISSYAPTIAPGTQDITDQVNVVYELN